MDVDVEKHEKRELRLLTMLFSDDSFIQVSTVLQCNGCQFTKSSRHFSTPIVSFPEGGPDSGICSNPLFEWGFSLLVNFEYCPSQGHNLYSCRLPAF